MSRTSEIDKICKICNNKFKASAPNTWYCPNCIDAVQKLRQDRHREANKKWLKGKPWLKNFNYIKTRINRVKGYMNVKNLLTHEEIETLWFRDKGYLLNVPSIDRLDSKGDYTFTNCRFIEHAENSRLGSVARWAKQKKLKN